MARRVTSVHRDHGVRLHLGVSVSGWSEDTHGVSVLLADGEQVRADAAVVGVGTRPRTDWLRHTGLDLTDGILCAPTTHAMGPDGHSVDGIVAAGDVARWPNPRFDDVPRRVEHWIKAIEMGRHAAEALLQGPQTAAPFAPVPASGPTSTAYASSPSACPEYFWEPVRGCWSIRPRGMSAAPMSEGSREWTMDSASPDLVLAPATTIAWRMAHLIVSCLGYRVGWYFGGRDVVDFEAFAYAGTADEALKQLDEMYERWNAGVRALSDADLDNPPPAGPEPFPMENRILHINRELIHHGAEISLLRDLYRRQDAAVPHRL